MPAAAPAPLVPLPDLPLEDVCRHREVGVLKTAISAWSCLTFLHSGFSNSRQVSLEALSGAGLVQKHRSNVLPEITHCHVPAVCTALVSYGGIRDAGCLWSSPGDGSLWLLGTAEPHISWKLKHCMLSAL